MNLVAIRTRIKVDDRKLKKKVQAATFRSLGHAGGAIRLTASRSIRRGKQPSRPGRAPHTPTGHLKRVIAYDVDQRRSQVVVGPTNEYSRTIWNLHEFGGTSRAKPKLLKAHKFQAGDYGPIRRSAAMQRDRHGRFARRGKTFARIQLRNQAQAKRATAIVANENRLRMQDAGKTKRYPKRPFMGPALEKMRERLPKFWANSVKA